MEVYSKQVLASVLDQMWRWLQKYTYTSLSLWICRLSAYLFTFLWAFSITPMLFGIMEEWNNPVKKDKNRTSENPVQQWRV